MKITLLFCCGVLCSLSSVASPLSPERALSKALAELQSSKQLGMNSVQKTSSDDNIQIVAQRKHAGINTIYLMNFGGKGYAVAADSAYPSSLIAMFDNEISTDEEMPPFLESILKVYDNAIVDSTHNGSQPLKAAGGKKLFGNYEDWDVVDPLIHTQWSQSEPYNNKCPLVSTTDSGGHIQTKKARVGCGAVALAQILRFHEMQWPFDGVGSAFIDSIPMTAMNLADKDYSQLWTTMEDRYAANDPNADTVADLMLTCAYAIESNFSWLSTKSDITKVKQALFDKCKFNAFLEIVSKLDDANPDNLAWNKMLHDELLANRPILYKGTDLSDPNNPQSHVFIIDGCNFSVDSNICYWHVNWGVHPKYNCYVALDKLTPQGTTRNYNMYQEAIIGIQHADLANFNDYIKPITPDGDRWNEFEDTRWIENAECSQLTPTSKVQNIVTGKTYSYGSAPNGVYTTTSSDRHFKVVKQ